MLTSYGNDALVLLGHGSTKNFFSSLSTRRLADELISRDIFSSVHVAFWKERPYFSEMLDQVREERIWVVPNFISHGYFTRQVIPRELKLSGCCTERRLTKGGEMSQTWIYCEPVGSHDTMTDLIVKRLGQTGVEDFANTAVIIGGHGTERNKESAEAVHREVQRLGERIPQLAEVVAAFIDEKPYFSDWAKLTSAKSVVVIPFFAADGLHTLEDIPRMLGLGNIIERFELEGEGLFPICRVAAGGRKLYYTRAAAIDEDIADVVLSLVRTSASRVKGVTI